jgi:hypothetical protein
MQIGAAKRAIAQAFAAKKTLDVRAFPLQQT